MHAHRLMPYMLIAGVLACNTLHVRVFGQLVKSWCVSCSRHP